MFFGKYVEKKMWADTVGFASQIIVNCDRYKNIISHITSQPVSIEMVTNQMLVVSFVTFTRVGTSTPPIRMHR